MQQASSLERYPNDEKDWGQEEKEEAENELVR